MTRKQRGGSAMVKVRANIPLWDNWVLIEPGTVYEQPVDAAAEMIELGLVSAVVLEGSDTELTPSQPTEED